MIKLGLYIATWLNLKIMVSKKKKANMEIQVQNDVLFENF